MTPEPPPLHRLLHLVDRAEDGVLLPAEAAQLRTALQARDAALAACTAQLVHDQAELADEQAASRSRTEQWRRVVHSRQHVEELCRQLAAALTEVLAEPRFPDSGGATAVYIGPVPCVRVERWRGVLKAAGQPDDGPSVQECAEQDAAHWNTKYDRP
ncbi:hypothetical protein [Streptomyces sp. NPDC050564]|uniref:hypothetical protein n=1 Tax=Streptomyces sp. NPDC050564 TaxID=3365631 RepID=UPI0037960A59